VSITERAAHHIVVELEAEGVLTRERDWLEHMHRLRTVSHTKGTFKRMELSAWVRQLSARSG